MLQCDGQVWLAYSVCDGRVCPCSVRVRVCSVPQCVFVMGIQVTQTPLPDLAGYTGVRWAGYTGV